MKTIGFFGGTFNPVHVGHIRLASELRKSCSLDEVWLSLSPQNPLKNPSHPGATDADRAEMLALACEGIEGLHPWTGELTMPRPSYTFNVLDKLAAEGVSPRLIIGADNWLTFDRWYRADEIIDRFGVIVYPRPGFNLENIKVPNGVYIAENVEETNISSSEIRSDISKYTNMLPPKVAEYIKTHSLYGYR